MRSINKISKILLSVVVFITALSLVGCERKNNNEKYFKIGLEGTYSPFNWLCPYKKEGGVPVGGGWYALGYDIEIAKLVAKGLARKLVIVKLDWDGLVPALNAEMVDAVIAGMSITPERKNAVDFTEPYYHLSITAVVKKSGKYVNAKNIQELGGARVTGQMGTFHYKLIDQIKNVIKKPAMEDVASMVTAVSSGQSDAFVTEMPSAILATHYNPDLTYLEFEIGKNFKFSQEEAQIAIALKKNSKLKDEINKIVQKIDENTRKNLMEKAIESACEGA